MAPKATTDGAGNRSLLEEEEVHPHQQQQEEQDEHDFTDSSSYSKQEDETKTSGNNNWKQAIVTRIQTWLERTILPLSNPQSNEGQHDSSKSYRLVATTIITFCFIYLYRYRLLERTKRFWQTLMRVFPQLPEYSHSQVVSLSVLRDAAIQGIVRRALVGPSSIVFQDDVTGQWKQSLLPSMSPSLQSDLVKALSNGGCTDVSALPETLGSKLVQPMMVALPFVYLAFVYKIFKNLGGGDDILSQVQGHGRTSSNRITFQDVAGLDSSIMEDIQELVSYLTNPRNFQILGAKPPTGVLLYGPPGTGKTLLAKAIASEANCDTFIACSGSDFCEMYVGRGAARIRALFNKARQDARRRCQSSSKLWNKPKVPFSISRWFQTSQSTKDTSRPPTAILFIDELDALAKSRSYNALTSNDERDQTLNQLLTEMDGFHTKDSDVAIVVIGASNRADVLDPAILRRFERQIHIGYPNAAGRKDILRVHARHIQCKDNEVHWEHLAQDELTGNFSGAELRNVVNDAALLAVRQRDCAVTQSHLLLAIQKTRSMKHQLQTSGKSALQRQQQHNHHYPFHLFPDA